MNNRRVGYIVQKYKIFGNVENKNRCDWPRKTSESFDGLICTTSKRNRRLTAPEILTTVSDVKTIPISVTTAKRRLHENGLYEKISAKKPLLQQQNKRKRLKWAKHHENWTREDWEKVLWTDESKIEVYGTSIQVFGILFKFL